MVTAHRRSTLSMRFLSGLSREFITLINWDWSHQGWPHKPASTCLLPPRVAPLLAGVSRTVVRSVRLIVAIVA
ncbi:hypothetical protein E2C01_094751 [Portunus trituberculatus]|uniref:Uncharacterized protein n=1 Tax=Portunus trituberculatus TaxID=210409 RepID=A0A5B7JTB7_PORTR|nr:hypothetical protein [Portunus trituberculatus]